MRSWILVALLAAAPRAKAQDLLVPPAERTIARPAAPAAGKAARGFTPLHVSDRLAALPESRAALEEYTRMRDAGLLPVARKGAADPVGTTRDFQVYNFTTNQRQTVNFTLKVDQARFFIWVQTSELGSRVSDAEVERLRVALAESTPAGSFDPAAGIIVNDEAVFGSPPNVDGDGKTDVLLVDIQDGYDPNSNPFAVTGFFYPPDLGSPVRRDILYLDTWPTLSEFASDEVLVTAAHEYQHLIHARYDPTELTFVNEGLSEWAAVMNGYAPRGAGYLMDLDLQRQAILDWPGDYGTDADYQRAGLFTTYLAERLGTLAAGEITRSVQKGAGGYDTVLRNYGLSLVDVVASFSAANFVNDPSIGAPYGYATAGYGAVAASSRLTVDGTSASTFGPFVEGPLARGGVDYFVLRTIGSLALSIDAPDGASNPSTVRAQIRPTVVLKRLGSIAEAHVLDLDGSPFQVSGDFEEVVIAVPHADLRESSSMYLTYEISASWSPSQGAVRREDFAFDDGTIVYSTSDTGSLLVEAYHFRSGDSSTMFETDSKAANRFDAPPGATLASVAVAPLYVNSFGANPPPAARDYVLEVFSDDGSGRPVAEPLFSLTRTDARSQTYRFQDPDLLSVFDAIDLAPYASDLSDLPGDVFVTIGNAGTDTNTLVMPVAPHDHAMEGPSPSFFLMHFSDGTTGWGAFATLVSATTGERPLEDRVLPIRASFLISTATASDAADLPTGVELAPAYPNPFHPTTVLAYTLDRPARARLQVFDALGRLVRTVSDGFQAAGRHEIVFDAGPLRSGMYFYRLEAAGAVRSRSMLLVR